MCFRRSAGTRLLSSHSPWSAQGSVQMALKMKITYSTMSADNEELQSAFDEAFAKVRKSLLGLEVPMFIDGENVYADAKTPVYSPTDTSLLLCTAQTGTAEHAQM